MSTEMNVAANKVIVVGMLDTMLVQDRNVKRDKESGRRAMVEVTKKVGRDRERGGRWENLTLQVRSPYGGMFAMKVELEPDVPGVELIAAAEAETLLAFEGILQLKRTFDGRFARDEQDARGRLDRGLPTRALQLYVTRVREPNAEERRASSAVWLEGVVAEPPQVSRHPELPSMQLAGTILRVTAARPADFLASRPRSTRRWRSISRRRPATGRLRACIARATACGSSDSSTAGWSARAGRRS